MSNLKLHRQSTVNQCFLVVLSCFYLGFSAVMALVYAETIPLDKPLPNASICPIPDTPCTPASYDFAPYDLSFNLPNKLKWMTAHNSNHFYAIVLKSNKAIYPNPSNPDDETQCGGYFSEEERLTVQALFPCRKVFASRHGCSMVWYNNINNQYNFLAIYAGQTAGEAKKVLEKVKATGQFTDANIRKMQVVVDKGH